MTTEEKIKQAQEWATDSEKRKQFIWQTNNATLHRCLSLFQSGVLSYQDALELAVCHLSRESKEYFERVVELTQRLPPPDNLR